MKTSLTLAIFLTGLGGAVHAHCMFNNTPNSLPINDTVSEDYQYIRKPTDYNSVFVTSVYNESIRCFNGVKDGVGTQTATVIAGTTIGVGITDSLLNGYEDLTRVIYHPGPARAYLSRAPNDDVEKYLGDGDWFKIGEYGPFNKTEWEFGGRWGNKPYWMKFTIPTTTPPGKYLLRAEQMCPCQKGYGGSQSYIACAHIDIIGPGGGTPGPTIKFPEAYNEGALNNSIAVPIEWAEFPPPEVNRDVSNYVQPGPPVWSG